MDRIKGSIYNETGCQKYAQNSLYAYINNSERQKNNWELFATCKNCNKIDFKD